MTVIKQNKEVPEYKYPSKYHWVHGNVTLRSNFKALDTITEKLIDI